MHVGALVWNVLTALGGAVFGAPGVSPEPAHASVHDGRPRPDAPAAPRARPLFIPTTRDPRARLQRGMVLASLAAHGAPAPRRAKRT